MAKEKQISLKGRDVELDAAIRYDYYPGGEFGEEYQEEYINVFRGNKHILVFYPISIVSFILTTFF